MKITSRAFKDSSRWPRLVPIASITSRLAYVDRTNCKFGAAAGLAEEFKITAAGSSLLGALIFSVRCVNSNCPFSPTPTEKKSSSQRQVTKSHRGVLRPHQDAGAEHSA